MVSRYQKLIKNSTLFAVSNFGSKVLIFFLMPLYTHVLSTGEMGIADAIYAACTVILYLVSFTISEATMRFTKMKEIEKSKVLANSLCIWFISNVFLLMIVWVLKKIAFFSPYIIFIFFIVLSQNFYMIMSQYARGGEKVRIFSIGGIIQTFFLLTGNIVLLVFFKLGIKGYLISYIIGFSAAGLYIAYQLKVFSCLRMKYVDRSLAMKMIRYSFPLIFTGLSWWILNASDKYVILHFMGASANGIYSVAHKIPTIIISINGFFNSAWQLSAIDEQESCDNELFYNKVFDYYSAVLYLIASGIILTSKYIMPLIITGDYYDAIKYVPLLVLSSLFQVYGNFFGGLNIAYQKTGNLVGSAITAGIINLGLNILLTPFIGMYGTAIATCIACAVMIIMRLIDASSNLQIRFRVKKALVSTALIVFQIFLFSRNSYISEVFQIIVLLFLILVYRKFLIVFVKVLKRGIKRVLYR